MTGYEVTSHHVPSYAGAGLPTGEVAAILHRLDPAAVQDAGAAQTALGRELDTLASQLAQEAGTLTQSWSGSAARSAQTQFQRLHEQTVTLAAQATRTGGVLTWLGTRVLPEFRNLTEASQAQEYLTRLSAALVQANAALPPEIGGPATAQLASADPNSPAATNSGPSNANSASPASPNLNSSPTSPASATSPASPGSPAIPTGTVSPASPNSLSNLTGTTYPGGTANHGQVPVASRLQAATAPSPVPAPAASPSSSSTTAVTASPAMPVAASVGAGAALPLVTRLTAKVTRKKQPAGTEAQPPTGETSGTGAPAAPLPEASPVPDTVAGPALSAQPLPELPTLDGGLSGGALPLPVQPVTTSTTSAPATAPVSTASASHGTFNGMPMSGGAAGNPNHERNRESWAAADDNPWGLPDACVPPLIEGS